MKTHRAFLAALVGLALAFTGGAAPTVSAFADVVPIGGDGDPGGGGGDPGTGGGQTAQGPSCGGFVNNGRTVDFHGFPGMLGINVFDVATGANGSVWYVSDRGLGLNPFLTAPIAGSIAGRAVAVDPSGSPWVVDFNNRIWPHADHPTAPLPTGLARDIAIGPNGVVWVIGTNSRNGSYQVWSWNGTTWTADPGSGMTIEVDPLSRPLVDGSDGKIWRKDGGANQGWSQLGGFADDIGVVPCLINGVALGNMWIIGHLGGGGSIWAGDANGASWTQSPNAVPSVRIAVDATGEPWAVAGDNELLTGIPQ